MDTNFKVYFDTKFTALRKDTDLISIGVIAQDSDLKLNKSLYIEFSDYDHSKITPWIKENVISDLIYQDTGKFIEATDNCFLAKANKAQAKHYIVNWLKGIYNKIRNTSNETKIQLVSNVCYYDFVLFLDLFDTAEDIPNFISPVCQDLNTTISNFCGISEAKAFYRSRERMINGFSELFYIYDIPQPPSIRDLDSVIPENLKYKKHNSLYGAYIIGKLDRYMTESTVCQYLTKNNIMGRVYQI